MSVKIDYLDGLRGVAAGIVVVTHFFQVFFPSVFEGNQQISHYAFERFASQTPINLLFNGNFSVCLFFVLSGYVLSHRFFQTKENEIVYSSALRRYLRLAIPAFCSVVIAYIAMQVGFGYYDNIRHVTMSTMPDPFATSPRFSTMLMETWFHTFFTYGMQYNPVLWTMTYELFGSFLIFGFILLCGRHRIRYPLYVLLIWWFLDSYYLGFILGVLLSDLKNSEGINRLVFLQRPWVTTILILFGVYFGSFPYVDPSETIYSALVWKTDGFSFFVFYHVLGSFLIIAALLTSHTMQNMFGSKWIAYLGKISFSLYLVHFTVICTLSSYLFDQWKNTIPYGMNVLVSFAVSLPVILGLSHLFYKYVDAKTLRLLSEGSRKLFKWDKAQKKGRATRSKGNGMSG